jgi:hypothetical protein
VSDEYLADLGGAHFRFEVMDLESLDAGMVKVFLPGQRSRLVDWVQLRDFSHAACKAANQAMIRSEANWVRDELRRVVQEGS